MCLFTFTVDHLIQRYGCKNDIELAGLLGFCKGTVSLWRKNGLPEGYQKFLNVESNTPISKKTITTSAKETT